MSLWGGLSHTTLGHRNSRRIYLDKIPPKEVNLHDMGVKENGSEEHLSIDVDMDGGTNIKMNTLCYPQ